MITLDSILNNINLAFGGIFNNISASAGYKKLAESFWGTVNSIETEIADSKIIISDTIRNYRYGKSGYYVTKSLAFQYGDNLVIDSVTLEPAYQTIDTTKQIVKQASFSIPGDVPTLKVAKINLSTNTLEKLSDSEKLNFDIYMQNFEIPGLPLTKVSNDANELYFALTIDYDKTYFTTDLINNCANAFNNFLTSFVLGNVFYVNDLQDYVKSNVSGVRNVFIAGTTIDNVGFTNSTELTSGYFAYSANALLQILDTANYNAV